MMHNGPVVTMATIEQIKTIKDDKISFGCKPIKRPKLNNLPGEYVLVIFERCSHNDGEPYERRYTAIPKNTWIIPPWKRERRLAEKDQLFDFVDCNARYYFKLPKGSWEFMNDRWFPRRRLHYDY